MATPPLRPLTEQEFRALAEHAGLALTARELEELRRLFERQRQQLLILHAAPVADQEPAGDFSPTWISEP